MLIDLLAPAVGLPFLLWGLHQERRLRLIRDVPTVSPAGAFIGLIETSGTVHCDTPLRAGLTDSVCVWHRWTVEEHWSRTVTYTVTDSKGRTSTRTRHESGWTTVADGGEWIPFAVADAEGAVTVIPENADVRSCTTMDVTCDRDDPLYYNKGPAEAISDSDHRRHFKEELIPIDVTTWVIGQARVTADGAAAELAYDKASPLFIISLDGEARVERGYWWRSLLPKLFGFAATIGVVIFLINNEPRLRYGPPDAIPGLIAATCGVYALCWVIGWIWLVYNSLVELRQRVRQAWSNIDVQLKRRHDLIAALLPVVQTLAGHERRVQEDVALLRAQFTVTPPGEPGADVALVGPRIRALAEAYPTLVAQDGFTRLHQTLCDCENRIALSRGWFNDMATNWNTRLERIPDRWVAGITNMRKQALLGAV